MLNLPAMMILLAPTVVGFATAFILKFVDSRWDFFVANRVARLADGISLKVLFPTFVLSALFGTEGNGLPQMNVVVGLTVPLLTLLLALTASRFAPKYFPLDAVLTFSTYGAGNRGMLMIVVLFGATTQSISYVTNFSLLDLGHAVFIIGTVPLILRFMFGAQEQKTGSFSLMSLSDNYIVVTFVWIVLVYVAVHSGFTDSNEINQHLESSASSRKFLFITLLFTSIFLKTSLSVNKVLFFESIRSFFLIRLAVAGLFVPIVHFWIKNNSLSIALLVFLFAPPASMMPILVARSAAPISVIEGVAERTAILNIVFVAALLLIVFVQTWFLTG